MRSPQFAHKFFSRRSGGLAQLLSLGFLLGTGLACDSKDGGDKPAAAEAGEAAAAGGESEEAKAALAEVAEMKAELEKGEDIKYGCAGNLAQYKALGASTKDGEKKAYQAMLDVCFVESPKALIANLRKKMVTDEVGTMDTVNLSTVLKDDLFPKDGPAAEVAAEAKKVLEIELPVHELGKHLVTAKAEKAEGKSVSMGCIKAKQVVDKSGAAMKGHPKGDAALQDFAAACPQK